MDSSKLEKLLEPLSAETPCGEDLEYDSQFGEMERAALGKGDQQFGSTIVSAEPPDWKDVRRRVDSLLTRTKDMRVAVYAARASLQLDGLSGFEVALHLLRGYIEQYWDAVHPELDRSDDDDPTYRTNTLVTLCDDATVLRELRESPIVSSRSMGKFSLRDIELAREPIGAARENQAGSWGGNADESQAKTSGTTWAIIEAAFSDASIESLQTTEQAARLAAEHVIAIEQLVTQHVGVTRAVSLSPVQKVLEEINATVAAQLIRLGVHPDGPIADEHESAEQLSGDIRIDDHLSSDRNSGSFSAHGKIRTRTEAIKALKLVCEFYENNEPSSPLPLLIRRAQRLASKNFLDILRDIAPDAVAQAELLGGTPDESGVQSDSQPAASSDW